MIDSKDKRTSVDDLLIQITNEVALLRKENAVLKNKIKEYEAKEILEKEALVIDFYRRFVETGVISLEEFKRIIPREYRNFC